MKDLRIVFMGTPEFAVASLRELVENKYNVVGVITMPDKPAGRGHKLQASAVKQYALEQNLQVLQPEKLKDEVFLDELRSWKADLQIVVAFRMLPEVVWNMPPKGTFNLHASLLPQYRGAAPINWAVVNGETETGVTTFQLTHEIDTGSIIKQSRICIAEADNAGTVHDKLMQIGAGLVCETVDLIESGEAVHIDQSQFLAEIKELKAAPKIFKETCELLPEYSVVYAHNLVRGMSPYPGVWKDVKVPGQDENIILKIYKTKLIPCHIAHKPGELIIEEHKRALICQTDGYLELLEIQVPGKKKMSADEWLRGIR